MKMARFYLILKSAAMFFILVSTLCLVVSAHTGGIDANGGHYDRSTGEYHYHHGYPAHQHVNGQCPYNFVDKSGQNSGSSGTSKNQATPASKSQAASPSKEANRMDIENTLLYLGISVVLYYISSWLHFFYLRLEDQNKRPFIRNLCFWFAFIVGTISAPVALAFIFLNSKKADHLTKISEKENYDKGYTAGRSDGYQHGYEDGKSDGFCDGALSIYENDKEAEAALALVEKYANHMNMSVLQYVGWAKSQPKYREHIDK